MERFDTCPCVGLTSLYRHGTDLSWCVAHPKSRKSTACFSVSFSHGCLSLLLFNFVPSCRANFHMKYYGCFLTISWFEGPDIISNCLKTQFRHFIALCCFFFVWYELTNTAIADIYQWKKGFLVYWFLNIFNLKEENNFYMVGYIWKFIISHILTF